MVRVLINAPKQVRAGQPFEVKLLINHPMESGQRRDTFGHAIPREIIHSIVCGLGGQDVFQADLFPAISANPFLAFWAVATQSADLTVRFTDDHGSTQTEAIPIVVA
jgi:sulfur-oxidizing protein SoxZ